MWKIFYDDGSTFSSEDGAPEDAPALGFICAVGYDETGSRYIMHGWDHYFYDKASKQWWGCDLQGLFDHLIRNRIYAYKMGRTVTKSDWNDIMVRANRDPEFPKVR